MIELSRRVHTARIEDDCDRALRNGDIAGAAYWGLYDAHRRTNARFRVAVFCVCAGMPSFAYSLVTASTGSASAALADLAQAALDVNTSPWPHALDRLLSCVREIDSDELLVAAVSLYASRLCLLDGRADCAFQLIERARAAAASACAHGMVARAYLHKARAFALLGKLDAALAAHDAALSFRNTSTGAFEQSIVLMLPPSHAKLPDPVRSERILANALHSGRLDDAWLLGSAIAECDVKRNPFQEFPSYDQLVATIRDPLYSLEFIAAFCLHASNERAEFALEALSRSVRATAAPGAQAYWHLARSRYTAQIDDAVLAAKAFSKLGLVLPERLALDVLVTHPPRAASKGRVDRTLTDRQREIVQLIRTGASNREIANALGISTHTVARHVTAIFTRLNLQSRWQIVDDATNQSTLRRE